MQPVLMREIHDVSLLLEINLPLYEHHDDEEDELLLHEDEVVQKSLNGSKTLSMHSMPYSGFSHFLSHHL